MDLLIRGGKVLLKRGKEIYFENKDILLGDGKIKGVFPPGGGDFPGVKIEKVSGLIIPPFINAHYHSHDLLIRGMGPLLPLELWTQYLAPLRKNLTPQEVYTGTLLSCMNHLSSGCLGVIDHIKLSSQIDLELLGAAIKAYEVAGIFALVIPVISDLPFEETLPFTKMEKKLLGRVNPSPKDKAIGEQFKLLDKLFREVEKKGNNKIKIGVGPSGPQRCSPELLGLSGEFAREKNAFIHMHVLETRMQKKIIQKRFSGGIFEYLDRHDLLTPKTQLVHMVFPNKEDFRLIASRGSLVVTNPLSNLRLGSGLAPLREMTKEGIPIGLGTDSPCCNDSHSFFETMKTASLLQNQRLKNPKEWVTPEEVFSWAGNIGEKIWGIKGEIEEGNEANFFILELEDIELIPLNNPLTQLIFSLNRGKVKAVFASGEKLWDKEKPTRFSGGEIIEQGRFLSEKRLEKYGGQKPPDEVIKIISGAYERENKGRKERL